MMNPVIEVENLKKVYPLYNRRIHRIVEAFHPLNKKYHVEYTALQDVSLKIPAGQSVGIIGKNGSGKSTLLKIISGVVTPTQGKVQVQGRISSLLELGVGFHPELTGRENIFFYGDLTGVPKEELNAKLDTIISFADIGDYIDQPVKTYSSGMFVRLAFSVAVQVDPDILIIDEALSVGDGAFVRKSFAKMDRFREEGKTIIFVSHDVESVKSFSDRTIVLNEGRIVFDGDPVEAAVEYNRILYGDRESDQGEISENKKAIEYRDGVLIATGNRKEKTFGLGGAELQAFEIHGVEEPNIVHADTSLTIELKCKWDLAKLKSLCRKEELKENIIIGVLLYNHRNQAITGSNTHERGLSIDLEKQEARVRFRLKIPDLITGKYYFSPAVVLGTQSNHRALIWEEEGIEVQMIQKNSEVFGLVYIAEDAEVL